MTDNDTTGVTRRGLLAGTAGLAFAAATGSGTSTRADAPSPGSLPRSVEETGRMLRDGEMTSSDLTRAYIECIDALEDDLNMFITRLDDLAMEMAEARDAELENGEDRGPLHGLPIVIKDIFEMEGSPTTVGSGAFLDRISTTDATVVRKLKEAGCVFLGKTNMNAFAAGVSGTNTTFGDTHNPWELGRSPGGSSSGTGAAIAANITVGGPATDTGGSIRVPASWLGIAGIRPTFGLVSLHGVFPRSHSLDTVGPLGRTVRDLAVFLDVMAGYDPQDPNTALAQPRLSYTETLDRGVEGLRFGLVENYSFRDVDAPVEEATRAAADTLADLGAEIVELRVEPLEGRLDYPALFSEILLYEFNQILGEQYRATPNAEEVYGPIVAANIADGSQVTEEVYRRRLDERPFVVAEFKEVFRQVDALLTPALPTVAPLLTAAAGDFGRGRQFTIPFSYTALPSVVVPAGLSPEGLPIGIQFVGDHFQEALLLRMAAAFEAATEHSELHPPIFCG